jgi:excisionase family DNA binding protein
MRPARSQPGRPRPHPSPGSPGLADGQGSWRGPDPARNEGKPNMTKQTNRKLGATAAASATAPDAYARITNRILADLEQGVRPWCKPWGGDQLGTRITRPRRANGKPYAGIKCSVSVRTVRRWIANGELAVHRLGGRNVRISEHDLAAARGRCGSVPARRWLWWPPPYPNVSRRIAQGNAAEIAQAF